MNISQKFPLFLLRVGMGWMMFYAGITKVLDPTWSATGYVKTAKTFPALYAWFAQPNILPYVDFLNKWGLTLIGASLILGIFVRWSSYAGIVMMLLYYFPILVFPYPNPHAYIVDEHVIYMLGFLVLAHLEAGRAWGIDGVKR